MPGLRQAEGPRQGDWPVRAVFSCLRPLRPPDRAQRTRALPHLPRQGPAGGCSAALPALREAGPAHPQALLEHAATASVPLARALEDFFTRHGLALPRGHEEPAAARRRQRRLQAIPPPLRAAAGAFAEHELNGRQRALRAGTRPRQHATIESHLTTIRDLAIFLTATTAVTDWATVSTADIEAFLATQPSRAAHRLGGLRRLFSFAARHRLILASPVAGITIGQPSGFHGRALSRHQQRSLFRRWTSGRDDIHPHEAATGLLALVHGATTQEICHLTVAAIDPPRQAVHLPGRPHPTPLDPWTWAAIQRCLAHRQALGTDNPHLLVTRVTKATQVPANAHYVKNTVAAAGVRDPPGCWPWSTPPTPNLSPKPSA